MEFYLGRAGVGALHDHLPLRVEDTLASACTIPAFLGHEVLRWYSGESWLRVPAEFCPWP